MSNLPALPDPRTSLLLLIDLQPVLLKALPDGPVVLQRCCFALEAALALGLPLLLTEQAPAKLGPAAPELLALAGKSEVLAKDEFSALANETVQAALRRRDIKHVVLCGIETPVCVYQTARGALAAGLQVTLLTDCVGGRRSADAATALQHLAALGVNLLPAETVFYALLHSARHPSFRSFTQLVKKYG
ncbi:MAG: isochorismatase family protein [Opitutaceae bacterium]|nr:isochorismatase family protein [Opitutaceae bacterium]